jgi:hypothetical protein
MRGNAEPDHSGLRGVGAGRRLAALGVRASVASLPGDQRLCFLVEVVSHKKLAKCSRGIFYISHPGGFSE